MCRGYDVSMGVCCSYRSKTTCRNHFKSASRCVCHAEWAFYQLCVFHRSAPSLGAVPDTWLILSTALYVCVCVCLVLNMCVLREVRFSWCLPVNSSFLPPGPVRCLIGRSDTGHLCFHPPPVHTQKPPLFDHFALFDWHICSKRTIVKGRGEIR